MPQQVDTVEGRERVLELDWLKGVAILSVVCIHAKVGAETLFFDAVVDRAVSVFVVLFGVTSEFWWKQLSRRDSHALAWRWYRARFGRLMLPVWTAGTLWWIAAIVTGHAAVQALDWRHAAATYIGYSPWIGISWFVTAILQLVLLFPLVQWFLRRAGSVPSLVVAALITAASAWYMWDIVDAGRWVFGEKHVAAPHWWYHWMFAPRFMWHVTAGIVIARAAPRPGWAAAVLAGALFLGALWLRQEVVSAPPADPLVGSLRRQVVVHLADVPLTLFLLGLVGGLRAASRSAIARLLAWCGTASWGIYLGHMLVHELVHLLGYTPEAGSPSVRLGYAALLLTGGVVLATVGDAARTRVSGKIADVKARNLAAQSAQR